MYGACTLEIAIADQKKLRRDLMLHSSRGGNAPNNRFGNGASQRIVGASTNEVTVGILAIDLSPLLIGRDR
jgi:hypothetical protein